MTGTDLEVEMVARCSVDEAQDGDATVHARKLFEIVRALPDGSRVTLSFSGEKATFQAGRSRLSLDTITAQAFPNHQKLDLVGVVSLPKAKMKEMINSTHF